MLPTKAIIRQKITTLSPSAVKRFIALLPLLLVFGNLSLANPLPKPPITTLAQLTDSIQRIMKKQHMPGLMLTLATRDSVLFAGGLGLADVANKRPVQPRTLFRIGSITKMFTTLGLLKLIEEGKLSLTDEVKKIAPEVPIGNPWEATHPVRVVNLLEHTAGFDDFSLNRIYFQGTPDPRGLAAVQQFTRSLRCRWRPGERMSYANPGFVVAGYLIEKFSKQPYEQYLGASLLRPLGMNDATLDLHPDHNPLAARGYAYEEGQYKPVPMLPIIGGADGAMNASANDMARWIQFFLNEFKDSAGESLLKPGTLAEMERVHSTLAAKAGLQTGYGLANYIHKNDGKATFRGHNGGIDGFISSFGYSQELGVGYALSNNGGQGTGAIEDLIRAFLTRNAPERTPTNTPFDQKAIAPFLGRYRAETPRNEIFGLADRLLGVTTVSVMGNQLVVNILFDGTDTLYQTGPGMFRKKKDVLPSIVFTHDADQTPVLMQAGSLNVQTGGFWWFWPVLIGLAVCVLPIALIVGLIWSIFVLRRQVPGPQVWPRLLAMLATVSLLIAFLSFSHLVGHIWEIANVNIWNMLVFMGTGLFGVLTGVGLVLTIHRFALFKSRAAAWFLLTTYGLMACLVGLLATYGWIGIRFWML